MVEKPRIQVIGEKARSMAEALLFKKSDGIASIAKDGDEWVVVVEVLERKAIPDTQDLISRYEMKFDKDGELTSYRRIALRHRGDMEMVEEEV
jgi:hypothetical protein